MRAATWLRTLPSHARLPASRRVAGILVAAFITAPGRTAGGWRFLRKAAAPASVPDAVIPFTAEDCVAASDRAMATERWALAAQWLERAHRLAPTSARVCADFAFALRQTGDVEGAIRMYTKAIQTGAVLGGEAQFHAALACLEAGRPLAEAEAWAIAAFDAEPEVALLAEWDDFGPLHGRPGFDSALRRARRKAGPHAGRT